MYKIDGTELYDYQQQLLQPPEKYQFGKRNVLLLRKRLHIPVSEKED